MTRCHDAAAEPPDTPHAAEPQGTNEENDVEIMAAPLDALTVAFVVSFAGTCPAASERRLPMSGADAAGSSRPYPADACRHQDGLMGQTLG